MAAAWHSLAHLAQPGTVLFLAVGLPSSPADHWHGHSQAQTTTSTAIRPISVCCWLCIWGLPGLQSSLDRGEGARAELSHPQLARGRGCSKERPTPSSPLQKQLKMKHTRLHTSARIRSRHSRQWHPHPPLPALEMPPGLPSIPSLQHPRSRLSPRQTLIAKLGGRKRLHPLPYLPVERCSRKGSSEGKGQRPGESRCGSFRCLDRSRMQWPWYGRAGGEGERSYRLPKDTNKRH